MFDKRLKKTLLICTVLLAGLMAVPLFFGGENKEDSNELEELLIQLDGVEEASVVYHYSSDKSEQSVIGVAIVFKGDGTEQTVSGIYNLVNALYDIPYNRIYVSH